MCEDLPGSLGKKGRLLSSKERAAVNVWEGLRDLMFFGSSTQMSIPVTESPVFLQGPDFHIRDLPVVSLHPAPLQAFQLYS